MCAQKADNARRGGGASLKKGAAMSELSKDDVVEILGSKLGDIAIAEIIATGITKSELVTAKARAVKDHKRHEAGPPQEPGHISRVVDILERLYSNGLLGEAGSTMT
jgi:hypothetical protein